MKIQVIVRSINLSAPATKDEAMRVNVDFSLVGQAGNFNLVLSKEAAAGYEVGSEYSLSLG